MSRSRDYAVRCPKCGSIMPFELFDSITSSLNPELRQQILDDRFETVVCPDCKAASYIQYDILYHDPARRFMVCVGTDYSDVFQQSDCPAGYKLRYVDDYKQLAEKIRIFEAGLNDGIMEITKEAMRHMAKRNLELYYAGSRRKLMFFTVPGQEKHVAVSQGLYTLAGKYYDRIPMEEDRGFLRINQKYAEALKKIEV